MYRLTEKEDVIRIPPDRLADDLDEIIPTIAKESFERSVDKEGNIILVVRDVKPVGDAHIVHGDGGVYQKVKYEALIFKPEMYEIVNATVVEVTKFGAFVRFGPLDGLIHISQIMDDHIEVDMKNQRLLGKDTGRELKKDDKVRARIVTVSLNERIPRDSKIGLTMRQAGLGKLEWIEEERKKALGEDVEEKEEKKSKKKKKK